VTASKLQAPIPRVALELPEAAAALGMSPSSFARYVRPQVRLIRKGALVLVPLAELERWAQENAEHVLGGVS
jgi:predicted DNA-binding transcriptional regulator AlpA